MWRGYGLALMLNVGCTRIDKAGEDATDPDYADAATTGYQDTDTEAETPGTDETGGEPPPLSWVAVDAGATMSCGLLSDDRVVCWGDPDFVGEAPTEPFRQISFGIWEGCGLRADGSVGCWCANPAGGNNDACEDVPLETGFTEVRTGAFWACAERPDHTIACWGQKETATKAPTAPVVDWSIEENIGCAILEDGSVTCWGITENFNRWAPDAAVAPPADLTYVQVAVGRNQACALDTAGEAHCWGSTQTQEAFPQPSAGPWASITSWNAFTCGLRTDGSAECWFDVTGVVNDGWFIPDEKWASLGLGEWDSCGITLDGRGVCFPEPFDSLGEQDIPDLADLVLPAGS